VAVEVTREPRRLALGKGLLAVGVVLVGLLVLTGCSAAPRSGVLVSELRLEHPSDVLGLAFSSSGDTIFTVCADLRTGEGGGVRAWSEPTGRLVSVVAEGGPRRLPHRSRPDLPVLLPFGGVEDSGVETDVAVSPTGALLAVPHDWGMLSLLSLPTGQPIGEPLWGGGWRVGSNSGSTNTACFSPSGERVAATGVNGSMRAWSVTTRRVLMPRDGDLKDGFWHEDCVHGELLGFVSEDGVAYATSSTLRIWSLTKQGATVELQADHLDSSCQFLSPRGTLWVSYPREWKLGSEGTPFTASIRSVPSGERVGAPVTGEVGDVIAFSPDDTLVAVVGERRVVIQEVKSGDRLLSFTFPETPRAKAAVRRVAFSPSCNRLALARGSTVFVFAFDR
jgi:WD40 repeat protein